MDRMPLLRPMPEGLEPLAELALDLRWTWSHQGDQVWNMMSPETWARTENPWLMLQSVSQVELEKLAANAEFLEKVRRLQEARREYYRRPGWLREKYPDRMPHPVAYFSMEFGLGEALPLYAGGLGVLAGDYLKTASDLHVHMVGIGLLYQEGYFRQVLDASGWQTEAYPYNVPTSLPISPVVDEAGGLLRIPLELPGRVVGLRVWQADVGDVKLYLLDSNDPLNSAPDRGITAKLYDARPNLRLMQEMVLGIAGYRLLGALNIPVEVCHMNEGHSAFVVLERARSFMQQARASFPAALWATRAGNIFTTHTPVAAGFDVFAPALVTRYFRDYLQAAGISLEGMLSLGRKDPANTDEPFNMAYLAMRGSARVNAVSQLHGKVSRRLFQSLYPKWPESEVPITHITNGMHLPSWDSAHADELWTRVSGKERWLHALEDLPRGIEQLSDSDLWALRALEARDLIAYARQRLAYQLRIQGADEQRIREAHLVLDSNVLTVGFARRFTAYKRPNLLLADPDRLTAIINNPKTPIQIIAAGKAHPEDEVGKRLVQQFVAFASRPAVRRRVVFLEDYDITMAQRMVQGVDLWLNTPRRPWEACGTSGMKVLVNGGINLSELDGWWAEAYSPELGWALGDGREHTEPDWDMREAQQLYDILENRAIPEFYEFGADGIPRGWVRRMRASMSRLAPRFSSNRMLREYVENLYLPSSDEYRRRAADGGKLADELCAWQRALRQHWPDLRFGEVAVARGEGGAWQFAVPVYFGECEPDHVVVQLYAEGLDGQPPVVVPMTRGEKLAGARNGYIYHAQAEGSRPSAHFTPRIVPAYPGANVPLEEAHILWQK